MRVQFVITPEGDGWKVARGHTSPLRYETRDSAVRAAETMARSAADRGDSATIVLRSAEGEDRLHSFDPERVIRRTATPPARLQGFDPIR